MTWLALLAHPFAAASTATQVAAVLGANLQRPDWSPGGDRLAFEANFHDKRVIELYVGEPDTPRFARIRAVERSQNPLTAGFSTGVVSNQVVHQLHWAPPPQNRYVFAASNTQQDYDLYLDGSGTVGASPAAEGDPRWSPDGRRIAFTSARSGEGDLYLVDRQMPEAAPRRLTQLPGTSEVDPAWSADGRSLAFIAHAASGDKLWLLPNLDGQPIAATAVGGSHIRPSWAPTGSRLAFYANTIGARWDCYVVDAAAPGTATLIAEDVLPNALGPSWTPDGRHLVLVQNRDADYDPLFAVNVANPNTRTSLNLGTVGHGDVDVVKRPDGAFWVAYVAQGKETDVLRDFKRVFISALPELN